MKAETEIDKFINKHYNLLNCTSDNNVRAKLKTVLRDYARVQIEKDRERVENYPNDGIIAVAHKQTSINLD